MKTMFKSVSMLAVAAVAGMGVVSCTADKDLYNPEAVEQNVKAEYEANFIKKFGAVAGVNWDMSAVNNEGGVLSFAEDININFTRAIQLPDNKKIEGITYVDYSQNIDNNFKYLESDGYFYVPAEMQSKMVTLKENNNNGKFGTTWAMAAPGNEFSIIPIRQGQSSEGIELHMVVGRGSNATDYTIWHKGELLQKSPKGENNWTNVGTTFDSGHTNSVNNKEADVRTKAYTFKDMPKDEPIYFYLYRETSGEFPSSLQGYLKDQSEYVGIPEAIKNDGRQVRVLGFEARWDDQVTDWDFEDLVFLIVGNPDVPSDIDPEKETFKQTIAKRYMIEDLGHTDDTDFNDIVVDVEKFRYLTVEIGEKGQIRELASTDWAEKATLRHLGGRLNFEVKIGNTTKSWTPNIDGNDVERGDATKGEVITVEGWDPDRNNISVKVWQEDGVAESAYTIEWPETGSVPLMIATPTRVKWSNERVSFIERIKEILASIF